MLPYHDIDENPVNGDLLASPILSKNAFCKYRHDSTPNAKQDKINGFAENLNRLTERLNRLEREIDTTAFDHSQRTPERRQWRSRAMQECPPPDYLDTPNYLKSEDGHHRGDFGPSMRLTPQYNNHNYNVASGPPPAAATTAVTTGGLGFANSGVPTTSGGLLPSPTRLGGSLGATGTAAPTTAATTLPLASTLAGASPSYNWNQIYQHTNTITLDKIKRNLAACEEAASGNRETSLCMSDGCCSIDSQGCCNFLNSTRRHQKQQQQHTCNGNCAANRNGIGLSNGIVHEHVDGSNSKGDANYSNGNSHKCNHYNDARHLISEHQEWSDCLDEHLDVDVRLKRIRETLEEQEPLKDLQSSAKRKFVQVQDLPQIISNSKWSQVTKQLDLAAIQERLAQQQRQLLEWKQEYNL